MNILVIASAQMFPNEGWPHAGIFLANLLKRVARKVRMIVVVAPRAYLPAPLRRLPRFSRQRRIQPHGRWHGIEVFRPSYVSARLGRHLWLQARSFSTSAAAICDRLHQEHAFDLVIGNGFGPPTHTAQRFARAVGRGCIGWACGSDVNAWPDLSPENRRFFEHNLRHCDLVLTASDALRRTILRRAPRAQGVHTFYRGIDLTDLSPSPDKRALRARLTLGLDRTYIMSAGAIARAKGVWTFYSAFRQLSGRHPALAALWVGGGPEAAALQQQARKDGLADRLILTGLVPRSRVLEYMQATDLMVFPSHAEGLPNVVMEALAAGLPTVATDVGGTAEVIAEGVTGLLVPPRNPAALASAAQRILQAPEAALRMAQKGRELILNHFDVDRNASVALEIFRHVARGGPADQPLPPCAGVEPGRLPIEMLADRPL